MSARVRFRAALFLALALANSGPAEADSRVYRWLDGEGRVHITATPPPEGAQPAGPPSFGTEVQVEPEVEPAPRDAAPPAPPPAPAPPAARAADHDDPCAVHEPFVAAWIAARRALPPLEAAIEEIEADPVQASTSEICRPNVPCTYSSFSRAKELRRANRALREAEDRLADAEERAHKAGTPDRCLIDPTD